MKRTWLVWILVGGVVVTVLIAFNYERDKETVPLSEIFPDKEATGANVEYEFFDTDEKGSVPMVTSGVKEPSTAGVRVSTAVPSAPPATAPVKKVSPATTSAPKTSTPVASAVVSAPASGKVFTIQVAAFKEKAKAQKAAEQAQQKGYSAYIDERSRNDGSVWYQVCIGKFDSQGSAKELLAKVKQDYKDGFIKTLSGK